MKTKFMMLSGILLTLSLSACFNGAPSVSSSQAASSSAVSSSGQAASSSALSSSSRASSVKSSAAPSSAAHVHSFTPGEKTGAFTPETCSCSLTAYRFDIADAAGWSNPNEKMNGKTSPNNASTWSLEGLPVGKYRVDINAQMTYSSHASRYWYNQAIAGNETSTSSGDSLDEDAFRYWVEVDDVITNPDAEDNFGELGLSDSSANTVSFISEVEVKAGAQNLVFKHGNIGYSVIVKYLRFVTK